MKRLYLHIGMHKTGSSSIQATLYKQVLGSEFHYFDLGVDNPTGHLLNIYMEPQRRFAELRRRGAAMTFDDFMAKRQQALAHLKREFSFAAPNLILSAEGLNHLNEGELTQLKELAQSHVDDISVIAYVRPPKGFMQSNFQQLVKGKLGRLDPASLYPHYRERFEKFETVFTRPKISYLLFSPSNFPGGCVVQDFCAQLAAPLAPDSVVRVNEGLSRDAAALLYAYRKHGADFEGRGSVLKENRALIKALAKLPGRRLSFHSTLVAPVLQDQVLDLNWMQERLVSPLAEDLLADDHQAIATEADLLEFHSSVQEWLAAELGPCIACPGDSQDFWYIATRMHALRLKLAGDPAWKAAAQLTAATNPSALQTSSSSKAELLSILQQIDAISDGTVSVEGFGQFVVRSSPTGDGTAKRIAFRPMKR